MAYTLKEVTIRTNNTDEGIKKLMRYGKILKMENCQIFLATKVYYCGYVNN